MVCTMADAPSTSRRHELPMARVAASYAYTSTTLLFGQGRRADLTRHAAFVLTELPLSSTVGLRFGAGGIFGGDLVKNQSRGRSSFGPGVTAFVGIASTIVREQASVPFLQVSATLSGSRARTEDSVDPRDAPSFTAFDLRGAAIVGKTLGEAVVPYAALRAFGGPIFYRFLAAEVTGTDLYKYQVGGGLAVHLGPVDAFVEGIPFGERGASSGLGVTF